jgi:methylmalonyl-CoA mutase C-terminal domain/subunit
MMGVDVHTKGIRRLATALRDRGVEVIYVGEHKTADQIVAAALAEDVDAVGLSFSTATYVEHTRALIDRMRDAGLDDIPVMIGGLIHKADIQELEDIGVAAIFPSATSIEDVMSFLQQAVSQAHPAAS